MFEPARACSQAAVLICCACANIAQAAEAPPEGGAVGTVIVESSVLIEATAHVELDRADIARVSAGTLGDLLTHLPSTKVQMNSRGEQVFALRGSDQRQVALTLDGAPLVSAWDGQLDLGVLPVSAIERVAITRGAASVLQGPNALAGAVNVLSRRALGPGGSDRALTLNAGPHWQAAEAFGGLNTDRHAFSLALGWRDNNGFEPGGEDRLLTGSDSDARSALLGWTYRYGDGATTALTLLTVDGSKGVTPERTNPGPRYWRYPDFHKTMLIWYGKQPLSRGGLDYSLYLDRAGSRIDQYGDDTYGAIINVEDGRDRAGGGRVQWTGEIVAAQDLTLSLHWTHSEHLFRERAASTAFTTFSQVLAQLAAEWRGRAGRWSWLAGGAYEQARNPATGPFPDSGAREDWAATAGLNYIISSALGFDVTLARKTRFPSLRETYNGALGRFVPNPELGPETSHSLAAGLVGSRSDWDWEVRGFVADITDGIARTALSGGQFTRVNQSRARITGVEFAVENELADWLQSRVEGTVLRARGRAADGDYDERLEYRPGINLGAQLLADLPADWRLVFGARHLADEHGLLAGNPVAQRLPAYTLWDVAMERVISTRSLGDFSLVLRLDNLADEYYETQWGLPGPGRRASIGLTWGT